MARKKSGEMKVPTGAILSKFLRAMARDLHTVDDDANIVTKAAALADMVWRYALGWEEKDPDNPEITLKIHPPDWRAVALLFDRTEGKVQTATPEDKSKTLAEKVGDLSRAKANSLAEATQEPNE